MKRATTIATDILQSLKLSLILIAIIVTVKILISHVKVVANTVLHPLQRYYRILVSESEFY
jgi:hypothetical protein